jgi:hypothetical protein
MRPCLGRWRPVNFGQFHAALVRKDSHCACRVLPGREEPRARLHADRTARCHCHHCHSRFPALACARPGEAKGTSGRVSFQPAPNRIRLCAVSGRERRSFPGSARVEDHAWLPSVDRLAAFGSPRRLGRRDVEPLSGQPHRLDVPRSRGVPAAGRNAGGAKLPWRRRRGGDGLLALAFRS